MAHADEQKSDAHAEAGRRPERATRPLRSPRCDFVYATLVFAVVGLFDPFGVSDLLRRYSQSLANQIFGSLYPARGQQEITVLLLTERTIERHGGYWPVRMGVHADALSQVLDAEPVAVFVDVWFKDDAREDPTVADLAAVLQLYRQAGIPVFVASREDSDGLTTRAEIADVAEEVWAPKVVDQRDRTAVVYPLHADRVGSRESTAAMALYRSWVANRRQEPKPTEPPPDEGAVWRSRFADDLHVIWGTRTSGAEHGAIACAHLDEEVYTALFTRLTRDPGRFLSDCPYTRTILLDDLTHYADDELTDAFAGKLVLYGAAPEGAVDLVAPPTHASLPGVYLHAMALDNLIVWGEDYVREADPSAWRATVFGLFEGIALLVTVAVAVTGPVRFPLGRLESRLSAAAIEKLRTWLSLASVLVLNLLFAGLAFGWLRLAPINWIGMLVACGVILNDHFFCPLDGACWAKARLRACLGAPAVVAAGRDDPSGG